MAEKIRTRSKASLVQPTVRRAGAPADGAHRIMIGGAQDPAETAADRIADRVMRMTTPAPVLQRQCAACAAEEETAQRQPMEGQIQRQANEEDDELQRQPMEENEEIQRQPIEEEEEPVMAQRRAKGAAVAPGAAATPASPSAARAIGALGSGRPLASVERAFFEPRFGADLSAVRIHDGAEADRASRAINARAFAFGRAIAFADGEYRPGTTQGRRLMAHELAHTVQGRRHHGAARMVRRRWTKAGIHAELCGDRRARRELRRLSRRRRPWTVIAFTTAFDRWRNLRTGRVTEREVRGLRGNTRRTAREIRLRKSLSNRNAASTLYHESFHALHPPRRRTDATRLRNEIDARVATERFHIRNGWPESVPGYRRIVNGRPQVDVAFITNDVMTSSHYNPKDREWVSRRYVGETTITGSWRCP